jgi:Bacterial PH domain
VSAAAVHRRTFRRQSVRIVIAYLWAVPAVFFGLFALALGPDAPPTTTERIVYAAIALPFAVLCVRTLRVGVVTGPDGVIVRNILRTHRIPWADVAGFEMSDWGGFPIGAVRRRDGSEQRAIALNPPLDLGEGGDRRTQRLLAELDGELTRARGA